MAQLAIFFRSGPVCPKSVNNMENELSFHIYLDSPQEIVTRGTSTENDINKLCLLIIISRGVISIVIRHISMASIFLAHRHLCHTDITNKMATGKFCWRIKWLLTGQTKVWTFPVNKQLTLKFLFEFSVLI